MGGNLTLLYAVRRGLSAAAPMEGLGQQDALSHLLCVICHKHYKQMRNIYAHAMRLAGTGR
jgi:hypothetical protein